MSEQKFDLINKYNQQAVNNWNGFRDEDYHIGSASDLRKNAFPVSKPAEKVSFEISSGVRFQSENIILEKENYSNLYTVEFDINHPNINLNIWVPESKTYPRNAFKKNIIDSEKRIALINGGFHFLTDDENTPYGNHSYNLCLTSGKIVSFPVVDRSAMLVINCSPEFVFLEARGKFNINGQLLDWSGAKTKHESSLKLYNIACLELKYDQVVGNSERRVLVNDSRHVKLEEGTILIGVKRVQDKFIITSVANCDMDLLEYSFILQASNQLKNNFVIGSEIEPIEISGYEVNSIKEGITTGPIFTESHDVLLSNIDRDEINKDLSLCSSPPLKGVRRKPRTFMLKTETGKFVMGVFDGAKKTTNFWGVRTEEMVSILSKKYGQFEGVILDSGKSSRIIIKPDDSEIEQFGNLQYGRFAKNRNNEFLWSYQNGRMLSTAITLLKNINS